MKNQYTIDEEEYFENLTQLVEHYKHNTDGLVTKLKEPVAKVGRGMEVSGKAFFEGRYSLDWIGLESLFKQGKPLASGYYSRHPVKYSNTKGQKT